MCVVTTRRSDGGTPDRKFSFLLCDQAHLLPTYQQQRGSPFFSLFFSEACRILEYFRVRFRQTGRGAFLSLSLSLSHLHTEKLGFLMVTGDLYIYIIYIIYIRCQTYEIFLSAKKKTS